MEASYLESYKPTHIASPIAKAGDRNAIQETADIPNNVSQTLGFPAIFSTPRADGGKSVSRKDMNGLLYLLSQLNYFYQYMGRNPWRDLSAPSINGYPKGACVWYDNKEWVSDGDDNTSTPGTSPATGPKWVKLSSTSGIEVSTSAINDAIDARVTKSFIEEKLQYKVWIGPNSASGDPVSGTIYFITE